VSSALTCKISTLERRKEPSEEKRKKQRKEGKEKASKRKVKKTSCLGKGQPQRPKRGGHQNQVCKKSREVRRLKTDTRVGVWGNVRNRTGQASGHLGSVPNWLVAITKNPVSRLALHGCLSEGTR